MSNLKKSSAMQVRNIPISEITPSPLNPRKTFDPTEIVELATSIKENGLIQPITLRKTPKGSEHKYEIVCGERRYRACLSNGMETIEAVVKDLDDKQAFVTMVLENLQRRDVDPLEEAAAIKHLYKEGGYKVAQIAKVLGKSSSFVADRIRLTNISDDFAALLRNKTLGLIHLQEIAKLDKEQQATLYAACFTPECIERWPQKVLKMELLASMIEEHVMNSLDKARFSPSDSSYTTCGSCEGCKLNTATFPKRFTDTDRPRCMKRELFYAKNLEAVARKAKASGLPVVYVGTPEENADILAACANQGIEPTPLGNREYVIVPKAPKEEAFSDKEYYAKRLANYESKKASFDDSLNDGTIIAVYEVSFNGNLSGEERYLYNAPADENGNVSAKSAYQARSIDKLKQSLHESEEQEQNEITEGFRIMLGESAYSSDNSDLTETETRIVLALMLKRMGYQFKKSIGIDFKTSLNMDEVLAMARKSMNAILREYLRMSLSEESVCYAADLGKLLGALTTEKFSEQAMEIREGIHADYEQKRNAIKDSINAFKAEMTASEAPATTETESAE